MRIERRVRRFGVEKIWKGRVVVQIEVELTTSVGQSFLDGEHSFFIRQIGRHRVHPKVI
jgi:hypothetical protein